MTLSELLAPNLVLTKKACTSKDELIVMLVEHIYKTELPLPLSPKEMLKKIKIREEIGGTLFPSGLSVPHARLPNYDGFILALGMPAEPIFHQGIKIRLMALMITNQAGGLWYLPTLAYLTKLSRDTEYFSRLSGAENYDDVIEILRERNQELT